MNKLHTYLSCLLLICTVAFLSCEKLEFPIDDPATNVGQGGTGGNNPEDNPQKDTPSEDAPDNAEDEDAEGKDAEQEDDPSTDDDPWETLVAYIVSHGTVDAPFTVADFKTSLPDYLSHFGDPDIGMPGMSNVYICGYIVGYIPKGNKKMDKAVFGSEGASQTNIVLADSPDEQDSDNCIAVELSLSTDRHKIVREVLNLADHPENLKKRFLIYGNIDTYMGTLGLKSARGCAMYNSDDE